MKTFIQSILAVSAMTITVLGSMGQSAYAGSSVDAAGLGAELPVFGARNLAMGNSGTSSLDRKSFNMLNPAAMAYNEHTVFGATVGFNSTLMLKNNDRGVSNGFNFKNLDMTIPIGFLGNIGVSYSQKTQSDLEFQNAQATSVFEGGLAEFTPTYAVELFDLFSVGFGYHTVMGRQRIHSSESVNTTSLDAADQVIVSQAVLENEMLVQNSGNYGNLSIHYHERDWDVNVRYQTGMTLERTFSQDPYYLQDSLSYSDSRLRPKVFTTEKSFNQKIPWGAGFGVAAELVTGHEFVADYQYQAGEGTLFSNPFLNSEDINFSAAHAWGLGWERFGSGRGFDRFISKVALRAGYFGKTFNTNDLVENGLSLGVGMPLGRRGSMIDLTYQGSYKGPANSNQYEEFDHAVYISLRGLGNWGEPSRRYR